MPIIITKPYLLNGAKRKELKEAGYIVIETENPNDITLLDELGNLSQNIVLESALEALSYGNDKTCRNTFGELIQKKLLKK